jgi:hypothetical protein
LSHTDLFIVSRIFPENTTHTNTSQAREHGSEKCLQHDFTTRLNQSAKPNADTY